MTKTIIKNPLNKISDLATIFNIIEIIGGGSFGTVYRATHIRTGGTKALKVGSKYDSSNRSKFHQEIKILSQIDHPNIVNLEAVYESQKKICLVLEYCPRDLGTIFREDGPLYEVNVQRIIQNLTKAIAYLHSNGIVHRDLKLENILLGENPKNPRDAWFVKLCDFGVSAIKTGSGYESMLNEFCGTPLYMAPEMETKSYSEQCDIWSLGIIIFLLLENRFPYNILSSRDIRSVIEKTEIDYLALKCSRSAAKVIQSCLLFNPALRITAKELFHMPWVQGERAELVRPPRNILQMMDEYNKHAQSIATIARSKLAQQQQQESIQSGKNSIFGSISTGIVKPRQVELRRSSYPKIVISSMTKDTYRRTKKR